MRGYRRAITAEIKSSVNSRNKGKRGEQELCRLLNDWFEKTDQRYNATRNLDQTRAGGHDVEVRYRGMARRELATLKAVFEVKLVKVATAATIDGFWDQAQEQAARVGKKPILAYRANRQPWRFRVMATDLLALDSDDDEQLGREWVELPEGAFLPLMNRFMN